jgi:antitoxin component of MazEF toxin-antitoxin module
MTATLKVARIGNSRGVRLPAETLRRYHIGGTVTMEERSDGILLRPAGPTVEKLSWTDTAHEMAAQPEDWGEWDATVKDGLENLPWAPDHRRRIAEKSARYRTKPQSGKRR